MDYGSNGVLGNSLRGPASDTFEAVPESVSMSELKNSLRVVLGLTKVT